MKQNNRLSQWQITLIVIGVLFIAAPIAWDILQVLFEGLADVQLEDLMTRGGFFAVGIVLLAIAGIYEMIKDARNKPTSKHIK